MIILLSWRKFLGLIIRPKKGNIVIDPIHKHPNMQSCEFVEDFLSSDLDINDKEQKNVYLVK